MKLLYCDRCGDIFSLGYHLRHCICGTTCGMYLEDGHHAEDHSSHAVPIGFKNSEFLDAIRNQPETGPGKTFAAFVVEKNCPTFRKQTP